MTSITVPTSSRRLAMFQVGSVVLGSLATALLAWIPTTPLILPLMALPHQLCSGRARRPAGPVGGPGGGPGVPAAADPMAAAGALVRRGSAGRTRRSPDRGRAGQVVGRHLPASPRDGGAAPLFLLTNLGEEIGWRGYALPRLQRRFSPVVSSLILGVCWAAFHVVALAQNPSQPWGYVAVGSPTLIAMSVVMTWLFNHTDSVVLMVGCHAMYDVVAIGVVPLAGTGVPLVAFALGAAVLALIAGVLVLLTGAQLGRRPARAE